MTIDKGSGWGIMHSDDIPLLFRIFRAFIARAIPLSQLSLLLLFMAFRGAVDTSGGGRIFREGVA